MTYLFLDLDPGCELAKLLALFQSLLNSLAQSELRERRFTFILPLLKSTGSSLAVKEISPQIKTESQTLEVVFKKLNFRYSVV